VSVKRRVRRLIGLVSDPLMNRIQSRIDQAVRRTERRLDVVEQQLHQVVPDVDATKQYLPIVMDVIASQNATEREMRRSVLALQDRVDTVSASIDPTPGGATRG
jgi:hypothetical protein